MSRNGPEVVGGERRLVAVHRLGPLAQHQAGVVDQHVEAGCLLEDLVRAAPHRGQVGQVEDHQLDRRLAVPSRVRDGRHRGPALVGVAGRDQHAGTHRRQRGGRLEADPGIAAGDDDGLALHVGHRVQPSS